MTIIFRFFKKTRSAIYLSVGEEGVVIIYVVENEIRQKFFTKSTEKQDNTKLLQLLNQDKNASIHIFLDTMDQTYVQKTIPGLSSFSIDGIAKSRIEREVPSSYLKTVVQLFQTQSTRKEWVYTFISAPYEDPLTKWIEFFSPFSNIIQGIYFLPIEVSILLPALRDEKRKIKSFFSDFFNSIIPKSFRKIQKFGWEIVFTQNKTGGFRQIAFLDGKIIFSRLINNINSPENEVLAGNIEEEIINAIEFINRLELGYEDNISVYFILSHEIMRAIRIEKLKTKNVKMYTPYLFARRVGALEAATERDKFCDPGLLFALARNNKVVSRVHVKASEKVFKISQIVENFKLFVNYTSPIFLIIILYLCVIVIKNHIAFLNLKDSINTTQIEIDQRNIEMKNLRGETVDKLSPQQVSAIVDTHNFWNTVTETPIDIMLKLSEIIPYYVRAKLIDWTYSDPEMFNFQKTNNSDYYNLSSERKYQTSFAIEILFIDSKKSFDEISKQYNDIKNLLEQAFPKKSVTISALPTNINFASQNQKIKVTATISSSNATKSVGGHNAS